MVSIDSPIGYDLCIGIPISHLLALFRCLFSVQHSDVLIDS